MALRTLQPLTLLTLALAPPTAVQRWRTTSPSCRAGMCYQSTVLLSPQTVRQPVRICQAGPDDGPHMWP